MTGPSNSAVRGAVPWSFVMSMGQIGLSSLTLFIMAALVGPAAFGTIALALVLVLFLKLLLEQGMGAAIVQREDLQREHLDAAFWMVMAVNQQADASMPERPTSDDTRQERRTSVIWPGSRRRI